MKFRATYNTSGSIVVDITVPEEVLDEHTDAAGVLDEGAIDDWVGEQSHDLASEHVQTWGIIGPVRLDMDLDGIGAETIERV